MARHLSLLNRYLIAAATGRIKRLLITMPPRHGKSMLTSQYFPAWYLGIFPDNRVIFTSYEADFAMSWGRKSRDTLDRHSKAFGVRIRSDSSAAIRWDVEGHLGGMATAGVGGPITGKGANLFIIDDPIKNDEEAMSPRQREKIWQWYQSTAYTRLEPDGTMILIMTRWNRDDLGGRVQANDDGEPWTVLNLPAIAGEKDALGRQPGEALWPERYSLDQLREIQKTVGPYWWGCLFQQDPGAEGGTEFPESWFGAEIWFDAFPHQDRIIARVIALDPSKGKDAKHGDYSALVRIDLDREGMLWVEADLARRPTPRIVEDGIGLHRACKADAFALEINQFQELLGTEFLRRATELGIHLPLFGLNNTINKNVRIRTLGPYLAQSKMRFKTGSPGTKLLVDQLRDFPVGEHDDGPDGLEMGVRMLNHLIGERIAGSQPELMRAG